MFRVRQSSIEAYLPFLEDQWAGGTRNGTELWRRLKGIGFRGSLRVVGEWSTRRRRAERALVKRQMYGRGKLDLLQARLIGAS